MNSLKRRLAVLCAIFVCGVLSCGALTIGSYFQDNTLQEQIDDSVEWIEVAVDLYRNGKSESDLKVLSEKAARIENKSRADALGNFLRRPNSENFQFVLKVENEYRRFLGSQKKYYVHRFRYFGAITLALTVLISLILSGFVFKFVLVPLKDISVKMIDFLNNRYTYQFTVPKSDEIGELHSTFNAMAQKVLRNIEELKSLDKAKSEFLSIASHELRTPLTSIKGSLTLLQSGVVGKVNEAAANLMRIASEETDRLIRLINELLDLAKIEARQFPLKQEWVRAADLSNKIFGSLQGFAGAADVKLALEVADDLELNVDADRFQQVVTNLLSNAIKYSPKKESVTLRFGVDENNFVRVEVSDRGRGIAPQDQEIIFEKFRQATSAQNPLVKGTGLGLAIAKALVEQHGGTIGVVSKPGDGSTFYFTLPEWRERLASPAKRGAQKTA